MQKSSLFKSKKRGFTLIEILVALAIIGILASIVLINVNSTRQKAKRTAALQSFNQIAKAMDMYSLEHGDFLDVGEWNWIWWYEEENPPPFVIDKTYPNWNATYYCSDCTYELDLGDNDGDGKAGCAYIYIYNPAWTNYIYKNILCEDCDWDCGHFYYYPQ